VIPGLVAPACYFTEGGKVTEGVQSLAQQVQEQTQDLLNQIQEQILTSAQDFYENSLSNLMGQIQNDRSQLQELLEQLPESQEEAREQLEQLVSSYEAMENSLEDIAQQQGVEDTVNQVAQQAQETAGEDEEPDATHAARQKAEQLGVDLSEVEGSGAGGRITVTDVVQAAQG
jgi:pyruvate/2-oxoglutarate dehydrogenase complex dihydrolipoamide acyltransferase (E2) component